MPTPIEMMHERIRALPPKSLGGVIFKSEPEIIDRFFDRSISFWSVQGEVREGFLLPGAYISGNFSEQDYRQSIRIQEEIKRRIRELTYTAHPIRDFNDGRWVDSGTMFRLGLAGVQMRKPGLLLRVDPLLPSHAARAMGEPFMGMYFTKDLVYRHLEE